MELDCYKWYQSQTLGDVPARRLNPKRGGHKVVCQQGRWAPKGGGLGGPHRLEKGTSVNENVGSQRGWIVRSHISWGGEQSILYNKGVTHFKNLKGKPERESPKRTISASGGLELREN